MTRPWLFDLAAALAVGALVSLAAAVAAAVSGGDPGDGRRLAVSSAAPLETGLLKPGDRRVTDVRVENTAGSPAVIALAGGEITDRPGPGGGVLSDRLRLRLEDPAGSALYEGPLTGLGTTDLGSFAAGEARTFRVAVSFPDRGDDNSLQGSTASMAVDWAQVLSATASGGSSGATRGRPSIALPGRTIRLFSGLRAQPLSVRIRCTSSCTFSGSLQIVGPDWAGDGARTSRVRLAVSRGSAMGGRRVLRVRLTAAMLRRLAAAPRPVRLRLRGRLRQSDGQARRVMGIYRLRFGR